MATSWNDGRIAGISEMMSTIPKRRGGDTAHPCARTPPGTPRRDPTRFPSLVAPALSEGREKRPIGRKSAGWLCVEAKGLKGGYEKWFHLFNREKG